MVARPRSVATCAIGLGDLSRPEHPACYANRRRSAVGRLSLDRRSGHAREPAHGQPGATTVESGGGAGALSPGPWLLRDHEDEFHNLVARSAPTPSVTEAAC